LQESIMKHRYILFIAGLALAGAFSAPASAQVREFSEKMENYPAVIVCTDLHDKKQESQFYYLGGIRDNELHYYHGNDRLSYDKNTGNFIGDLSAPASECIESKASLSDLADKGRVFLMLEPFTPPQPEEEPKPAPVAPQR
jgi:hypothetical protein